MKSLLLACLVFLAPWASASKLGDLNRFGVTQTGNTAKVGTVSGSTVWGSEIPISPTPGGWSYAGNYGIPQAAKGPTMTMSHSGNVFMSGTKYPFQAGYTVPASTLVDAAAAIVGGPVGIGLFALPFALDWLTSAGGRVNPAVPTELQRTDPSACTVAPCYQFASNYTQKTVWGTIQQACANYKADLEIADPPYYYVVVSAFTSGGGASGNCSMQKYARSNNAAQGGYTDTMLAKSVSPVSSAWLPSSMDDIAPYMKNVNFDPRVVPEILSKGGEIPFPAPTVTGPTEILGPKTETPNPDGSKTVLQPLSKFTFSGDTITNTTNETTVTVVNVDNSIRSSSTTVTTPSASSKPDDPCVASPGSIGCAKFGTPDTTDKLVKTNAPVSIVAKTFAGSANCPSPVTFSAYGVSRSFSYQPLCDKLALLRVLFLALAAFIAAWVVASTFKV